VLIEVSHHILIAVSFCVAVPCPCFVELIEQDCGNVLPVLALFCGKVDQARCSFLSPVPLDFSQALIEIKNATHVGAEDAALLAKY
jgi:hypothetical protein